MAWSREVMNPPLNSGYLSRRGKAMEKSERKVRATLCSF